MFLRNSECASTITCVEYEIRRVLELGVFVRRLRESKGMTQAGLAERAGVSRRWLVMLENGRNPGAPLDKIIDTLQVVGGSLHVQAEDENHA